MDLSAVIKNRYSCKKFSDREVEKEKLDRILEAGRVAYHKNNVFTYPGGKRDSGTKALPNHNSRKALTETVTYM